MNARLALAVLLLAATPKGAVCASDEGALGAIVADSECGLNLDCGTISLGGSNEVVASGSWCAPSKDTVVSNASVSLGGSSETDIDLRTETSDSPATKMTSPDVAVAMPAAAAVVKP